MDQNNTVKVYHTAPHYDVTTWYWHSKVPGNKTLLEEPRAELTAMFTLKLLHEQGVLDRPVGVPRGRSTRVTPLHGMFAVLLNADVSANSIY